MKLLGFLLLSVATGLHVRRPKLHTLNPELYPEALCLDGSPAAYWHTKGKHTAKTAGSWIIFLEGGGECISNVDCLSRKKTYRGSSENLPAEPLITPLVLSTYHHFNPEFAGWNHVIVHYCTGDLHLGTMTSKDEARWGWARFRGHHVLQGVLQDLEQKHKLGEASQIVLAGQSAGGIGTFAHLDWFDERYPAATVVGFPHAGYYWHNDLIYQGPDNLDPKAPFSINDFEAYHKIWNMFLPSACVEGNPSEPWVCALANFSFPSLSTSVFVAEALVDRVQLQLHSGIDSCFDNGDEMNFCLAFGREMTTALQQVRARALDRPDKVGLWAPACFVHTQFFHTAPLIEGQNVVQAFGDWFHRRSLPIALVEECCSGDTVLLNPTCPGDFQGDQQLMIEPAVTVHIAAGGLAGDVVE